MTKNKLLKSPLIPLSQRGKEKQILSQRGKHLGKNEIATVAEGDLAMTNGY
jgi:hypothetical protein